MPDLVAGDIDMMSRKENMSGCEKGDTSTLAVHEKTRQSQQPHSGENRQGKMKGGNTETEQRVVSPTRLFKLPGNGAVANIILVLSSCTYLNHGQGEEPKVSSYQNALLVMVWKGTCQYARPTLWTRAIKCFLIPCTGVHRQSYYSWYKQQSQQTADSNHFAHDGHNYVTQHPIGRSRNRGQKTTGSHANVTMTLFSMSESRVCVNHSNRHHHHHHHHQA
jgi:hypothetical protein